MSFFLLGDRWSSLTPTAAGFSTSAPAANVADQRPGITGRSGITTESRFEVEAGVNDKIAFSEGGGTLMATLTANAYTATALCAEIKTQLEAAGALTYTVIQNVSGFFRIDATGAFILEWADATAGVAGCAALLGWDDVDTASATSQVADLARWSGALALVYDLTTALKVRPCAIAIQVDTDAASPTWTGLRVFGSDTNHGTEVGDWVAAGAEEFVLSSQSTKGYAPLRLWFGALSGGSAKRYWLVHWAWTDDGLSHGIGLARMWGQSDPVYDSTTGRRIDADAAVPLAPLGGMIGMRNQWPAVGAVARAVDATFSNWPVAAWEAVADEVSAWGSANALLWVAYLTDLIAGNAAAWLAAQESGLVLWAGATIEGARLSGTESGYRSGALRLEQVR